MDEVFDLVVIGGGINGCGAAADAALRGLSVVLLEKDDLASKTSSSSSKLIHGGLRYLEQKQFRLVRKALNERQRLLMLAPHLVRPQAFVLPYQENMRPTWLLRAGLFVYDHLSRSNQLPHSRFVLRKTEPPYFFPLKEKYNKGFLFYDCITDDSRLTITNALLAKEKGAVILNYMRLDQALVINGLWHLRVKNQAGLEQVIRAKALINATGPWVESVNVLLNLQKSLNLSLVKGSHLMVHKLYEGNQAYLLQHEDKRIVFIVPYRGYTMIGTTDVSFGGSLDEISISEREIDYLCRIVNNYLHCEIQKKDIINTWSGVRPLLGAQENPALLSRDYAFLYNQYPAPAISLYGGKITTYRQFAEEAVNALKAVFPALKPSQTKRQELPGSRMDTLVFKDYCNYAEEKYFWLKPDLKQRYLDSYGSRIELILANCNSLADLGKDFGNGLYQREIDYLRNEEWALYCDDILWRRSKLGLHFDANQKKDLAQYLDRWAKAQPTSR